MATSLQLKNAIDQFVDETAVRAFAIVNGATTETVITNSGEVKTFAKAIYDFENEPLLVPGIIPRIVPFDQLSYAPLENELVWVGVKNLTARGLPWTLDAPSGLMVGTPVSGLRWEGTQTLELTYATYVAGLSPFNPDELAPSPKYFCNASNTIVVLKGTGWVEDNNEALFGCHIGHTMTIIKQVYEVNFRLIISTPESRNQPSYFMGLSGTGQSAVTNAENQSISFTHVASRAGTLATNYESLIIHNITMQVDGILDLEP